MSETAWPSRAQVPPFLRPEVMIGAASPLWGYIGGTVAVGVGVWWMTRWMHLGERPLAAAPAPSPAAASLLAATALTPPTLDAAADELPEVPTGGEAAPISPLLESPAVEAALSVEVAPPVEPEAAPEPAPASPVEAAAPVAPVERAEPVGTAPRAQPAPSPEAAPPVEAPMSAEAAPSAEKPPRAPSASRARKARDPDQPKPH